MSEVLLKPVEAGRRLSVTVSTLRNWAKAGSIEAVRLPSGKYRYPLSEIERLMEPKTPDALTDAGGGLDKPGQVYPEGD